MRSVFFSVPLLVASSTWLAGCSRTASATGSASASASAKATASAMAPAVATSSASAAAAPSASVSAAADTASDPLASPKLLDDAGKPLTQTQDKPSIDSPAFQKRAELLFQAIQKDDPSVAAPAFFPKVAYGLTKDIKNADKDWDARLFHLFSRDIHEYHKRLGKTPEQTQYEGISADDKHMKWIDKGGEGNRLGYYRLFGTKLKYKNAKGKESKLEVTSLISWRGEWFVVHLHGTK